LELKETLEHPVMVHLVDKPFIKGRSPFYQEWWDFAGVSGFRDEIMSKYGAFMN